MDPKSLKEEKQLTRGNFKPKTAKKEFSICTELSTTIASTQFLNQIKYFS